jgi:hypothetical protein
MREDKQEKRKNGHRHMRSAYGRKEHRRVYYYKTTHPGNIKRMLTEGSLIH